MTSEVTRPDPDPGRRVPGGEDDQPFGGEPASIIVDRPSDPEVRAGNGPATVETEGAGDATGVDTDDGTPGTGTDADPPAGGGAGAGDRSGDGPGGHEVVGTGTTGGGAVPAGAGAAVTPDGVVTPDDVAQLVGPRAEASLFEPVQVTGAGYLIERPDISQAVCTDHDVRQVNLTALRPVAGAHPYPLVFSSVSGAHLYGFPSADSDIDLRGVHLLPAAQVVGLRHGPQTVERTWLHHEVKLDLVTHDIGKFIRLMVRRNGYVLEPLLSPLVVTSGPVHEELVMLAGGCLTRGHAHHYRGFAHSQWEQYQQTGQLKPLLYTFRLLLTGIHLMRTGELVTHLPTLLDLVPGVPAYLADLVELKSSGESGQALDPAGTLADDVVALQAGLDIAEGDSPLPDHPGAEGALHDLLVRVRLESTPAHLG